MNNSKMKLTLPRLALCYLTCRIINLYLSTTVSGIYGAILRQLITIVLVLVFYGVSHTTEDLLPHRNEVVDDIKTGLLWGILGLAAFAVADNVVMLIYPQGTSWVTETKGVLAAISVSFIISNAFGTSISQELLFRGVWHRTLLRFMPFALAAGLSGLVYAAWHYQLHRFLQLGGLPHGFLQLWVLGIVLALSYGKSKSLLGPIVAHMTANTLPMLIALILF